MCSTNAHKTRKIISTTRRTHPKACAKLRLQRSLDPLPLQALRIQRPTWVPIIPTCGLGGVVIVLTSAMWLPVLALAILFIATVVYLLWAGTAMDAETIETLH